MDELKGRRVHAWVMLLAGKRLLELSEDDVRRTFGVNALAPYQA